MVGTGHKLAPTLLIYSYHDPSADDLYRKELNRCQAAGAIDTRRAYSRRTGESPGLQARARPAVGGQGRHYEALGTTGGQFLSTLLLSDFHSTTIKGLMNITAIADYETSASPSTNYFAAAPAANWRFAEEPGSYVSGDAFQDTGNTYRASMPLTTEAQRTSLRDFQGPAEVLNFRVLCASPRLTDLVFSKHGGGDYYTLSNESATGLTTLCYVLPFPPIREPGDQFIAPVSVLAPQTYMILDFTFHNYSKFNLTDYTQVPATMARTDGPWSIVLDHNGEDLLRTSMCYTNQSSQFLEVQMTSSKDGPEPVTPWRRALNSYDTTKSRSQLGASLEPLSSRLGSAVLIHTNIPDDLLRLPPGGVAFHFGGRGLLFSG
ncbi:uncharacterized protein E0L32_007532 [Thyridium curvatum]|uniref:Uncharacterized protein n=1 Tax=Thyridium curvatum TaxID=1093900 RepID=A0A507AMA1_9PEZI|nr:uncharacterized protein E0L32_007532 [Thyridium curvatum]TPX11795.1 hypothetical protein E0L32_007532 [Thyridium curvatum]